MAAAGTHSTPTKHPRAREERERARKSAAEHLQQASAEIDKARQGATADVRRSLDSALGRMRDVSGELRQRRRTKPLSGRTRSSIRVRRLGARWAAAASARSGRPRRSRDSRTRSASRRPSWGRRRRRATVQKLTDGRGRAAPGRPPSGCVECRIQNAAGGPVAVLPESVRRVGRVKTSWPRSTSWS
jgi:hypothetical protein